MRTLPQVSGRPLDLASRGFLESRLGFDFSRVRVHRDERSRQLADRHDALAITVGSNILLSGQAAHLSPQAGRRLLAHEAAHVMQQEKMGRRLVQRYPRTTAGGDPNVPGVNHAHAASGRWWLIQAIEAGTCLRSPDRITCACAALDPMGVVGAALAARFGDKPLATRHVSHYLSGGGADFTEDVGAFIKGDPGVRGILATHMAASPRGHFKVEQSDYVNQDFRFSFGAIDRLDYRVDSGAGVVHVWFVDRYEWHPVYPGIYTFKTGDGARSTNCVHAAFVELKRRGANDFWMVGYEAIPLSKITSGGSGGSSPGSSETEDESTL